METNFKGAGVREDNRATCWLLIDEGDGLLWLWIWDIFILFTTVYHIHDITFSLSYSVDRFHYHLLQYWVPFESIYLIDMIFRFLRDGRSTSSNPSQSYFSYLLRGYLS